MSDNGLDAVLSRVTHWLDSDGSESTADLPADGDSPPELPEGSGEEALSPADFLIETGMSREEYTLQVIRAHDGCVRQRVLYGFLDRSDSAVSRLLSGMEEAGVIDRWFVDGEKVVTLPDGSDD